MTVEQRIESNPDVKAALVDRNGNALIKYKDGKVTIQIATEAKERNIGFITGDILNVQRSSKKHLHRKSQSYGFNWQLLKRSKFIWVFLTIDDEYTYKIPKDSILQYGKVLHFKNAQDGNSFELQIFLHKDIINKYQTHESEPKKISD